MKYSEVNEIRKQTFCKGDILPYFIFIKANFQKKKKQKNEKYVIYHWVYLIKWYDISQLRQIANI
jgi:hypothetical protein